MLPQSFYDQFKNYLMNLFGERDSFIFCPMGLTTQMEFDDKLGILYAPISFSQDFRDYFESQGFFINEFKDMSIYSVSIAS